MMDWLEANAQTIAQYPTADAKHTLLDEFAADLFETADNQDRSPQGSTDDTCRTFLAIAILIDVTEHFGPLSEASQAIRKYATWKAADIRRSLKAGVKPMAGGPPEIDPFYDADAEQNAAAAPPTAAPAPQYTPSASSYNNTPSYTPQAQAPPQYQQQQQQQQQQQPPQQQYQAPTYQSPSNFVPQLPPPSKHPHVPLTAKTLDGKTVVITANYLERETALAQADRLSKHASSAISFDDPDAAYDKLQQAISLLIPHLTRPLRSE
eukprot:UN09588